MSYLAENLMRQHMSAEEYKANVEGFPRGDTASAPAAAAAAETTPAATTATATPTLSEQQAANITAERERYARAGYSDDETSLLLGGPRQTLGA